MRVVKINRRGHTAAGSRRERVCICEMRPGYSRAPYSAAVKSGLHALARGRGRSLVRKQDFPFSRGQKSVGGAGFFRGSRKAERRRDTGNPYPQKRGGPGIFGRRRPTLAAAAVGPVALLRFSVLSGSWTRGHAGDCFDSDRSRVRGQLALQVAVSPGVRTEVKTQEASGEV